MLINGPLESHTHMLIVFREKVKLWKIKRIAKKSGNKKERVKLLYITPKKNYYTKKLLLLNDLNHVISFISKSQDLRVKTM